MVSCQEIKIYKVNLLEDIPALGGVLLFQHQKRSTSTLDTSCKSISTARTGKRGGGGGVQVVWGRGVRSMPQRASVVCEKISMETER